MCLWFYFHIFGFCMFTCSLIIYDYENETQAEKNMEFSFKYIFVLNTFIHSNTVLICFQFAPSVCTLITNSRQTLFH